MRNTSTTGWALAYPESLPNLALWARATKDVDYETQKPGRGARGVCFRLCAKRMKLVSCILFGFHYFSIYYLIWFLRIASYDQVKLNFLLVLYFFN